MTMPGGGGEGDGDELRLPPSPSTLNRIAPILLIAAEIEHDRPRMAASLTVSPSVTRLCLPPVHHDGQI
jgi:hypothetical protein